MFRFFLDEKIEDGFILQGEDYHHLISVLRHQKGDNVEVVHNGTLSFCVIDDIQPDQAFLKILKTEEILPQKPELILYQGLCKGTKMDTVVQKAVELGVTEVVPVFFKRSVVKPTNKDHKKAERLREVAKAAAKQSKNDRIPFVRDYQDFEEVLEDISGQILVAYEDEKEGDLHKIFTSLDRDLPISIFIGPEGGLEKEEVEALQKRGAKSISLGKRIIRTETAGMVVLTLLQYELGGMR